MTSIIDLHDVSPHFGTHPHHREGRSKAPAIAVLVLLASLPSSAQGQQGGATPAAGLFSDIETAVARPDPPSSDLTRVPGITTIRSRPVQIDVGQLAAANAAGARDLASTGTSPSVTLTLNLFDDVVLGAVVERSSVTAAAPGYVVSGRLDGVPGGTWKLLVFGNDVVTGTVRTPTTFYSIRTVDGVHVISQVDTSSLPRFEDRAIPAPPGARPSSAIAEPDPGLPDISRALPEPSDFDSLVDVAIAYTPAAEAGASDLKGDAGIAGLISEMIDNAHEAYERSGAMIRLRLAWRGTLECSGSTCSDKDDALEHIATQADLRTKFGADLLSWIVDIPEFAGVAHHGGYYSVVNYNQEVNHYTFAHELGHNMYLNHDRWTVVNNPDGGGDLNDPYPYSHGYISRDCGWRTIMAYPDRCPDWVPALPSFSNPHRVDDGEMMGVFGDAATSDVDGPANAVRSLNEKRLEVARYWHPLTDREVLEALYYSTARNSDGPVPRVAAFDDDGRIVILYWRDVSVSQYATMPDYIGNLTEAVHMNFWQQTNIVIGAERVGFYPGPIPATIGNLSKLEVLELRGFRGEIPATIGNLGNLSHLHLSLNRFTGIPAEIGNLTSLKSLGIIANCRREDTQLAPCSIGEIPAEIGNLFNLWRLELRDNELTGEIPATIGKLIELRFLLLFGNRLTGEIPATIGNLAGLEVLRLDLNRLSGEIPATIGNLAKLGYLRLGDNELTGQLPATIGKLSNLVELGVDGNQLSGAIPAELGNLSQLRYLYLDADTGLCLARDFPLNSRFGRLAQDLGIGVCAAGNRPPEPVGTLAPMTVGVDGAAVRVDVSGAFRDPDGDALTYGASSSAPAVVSVAVSGSTVTVTPVAEGTALVTVTATDSGGSNTSATQSFEVTVARVFTDHAIVPGETPVRAVHFTELRRRIDGVRVAAGLGRFGWTDPVLTAGVTPVRSVHLVELRSALGTAYSEAGRPAPSWTDAEPEAGTTAIRAVHVLELRAAVVALE